MRCLLWEACYLGFLQYTELYAALYTSQAQLRLISLTNLDAQYTCKSNLCLKWQPRKEGYTISDHLHELWFKRLSSTDQELQCKGSTTFNLFNS